MRSNHRSEVFRNEDYEIRVLNGPPAGLRDAYHALLRASWTVALAAIAGGYLALNALFAALYAATGGIANARPGSFVDAFFFSVQTMGTIGYGAMVPTTTLANTLVVAESIVGLVVTALATGLVFARFSRTRPRVIFCARAAIAPMDGIPTLMVRVGNERRNAIVGATFRATLARTTRTGEGVTVYLNQDLALVRDQAPALSRSWTILHRIQPGSPLHGETPASLAAAEAELTVAVSGTDDTSLQPIHAQHTWLARNVAWGSRLADVISEAPDGNLVLDLARFHDLTPTEPTGSFPYGGGPGRAPADGERPPGAPAGA